MSTSVASAPRATRRARLLAEVGRLYGSLERVPYSVLALPLRIAVAVVFWNSALAHLSNWDATLQLFEEEYQVPLLPPDLAAHVTAVIEIGAPVLLVLGLATRPVVLVLLAMTAIIEIFVYPQAWPTHIQWAAMMLVLLCRGAGSGSLDSLIERRANPSSEARR